MLGGAATVYAAIQTIDSLIPLMTIFIQLSPVEAIGRNNINGKCVCVLMCLWICMIFEVRSWLHVFIICLFPGRNILYFSCLSPWGWNVLTHNCSCDSIVPSFLQRQISWVGHNGKVNSQFVRSGSNLADWQLFHRVVNSDGQIGEVDSQMSSAAKSLIPRLRWAGRAGHLELASRDVTAEDDTRMGCKGEEAGRWLKGYS